MISVIMSVYNGERFISEQIASILSQDFNDFEIIIVDDHSNDNSIKIAIKLFRQNSFDRYTIIRNDLNLGVNRSLEIGVRNAKGDLIALSDQDDIWFPKKLQRLKAELDKSGKDLIYSQSLLIKGNKKTTSLFPKQYDNFPLFNRLQYNQIRGATVLATKDFLLRILPFSKYDIYDKWIYFHSILFDCAHYNPKPLDYYRLHEENVIGNSFNFKNKTEVIKAFKKKISFYMDLKNSFNRFDRYFTKEYSNSIDEIIQFFTFFIEVLLESTIRRKFNFYLKNVFSKSFPIKEKFIFAYYIFFK